MCFLNFIEQHNRVGVTAHAFCQLSTFLIAHIARRRADQSRRVETLRIFAHVDTNQGILTAKHELSQFLGEISLTNTRRTEEHKYTDGVVGILQTHTVPLDRLHHFVDGLILGNHGVLQFLSHTLQTDTLLFSHPLCRHTRHHRHDLSHLFGIYDLTFLVFALAPALVHRLQFSLQLRLSVTIACSQFEVLVLNCQLLLLLHIGNLLLLLGNLWRYLRIRKMYA